MRIQQSIAAMALLLWPFVAWSQLDEDDGGVRDNYTLVPGGQVLVTTQPNNDQSGLVRQEANGTLSTIVTNGQSLGGGTLDGIGAQPHMNAAGVAAFQVCLDRSGDCDGGPESGDTGIYTGTPGSVTEIATSGDTVAGEVICNVEPYPQINASNQVFWGTTVEGGDGVQDTCDPDGDDDPNGRKAIYRFTPPSTDTLMLLADCQGDGADTVTAVPPFGTQTFDIVDAHLIAHAGDSVTASGNALVKAWLNLPGGAKRRGDHCGGTVERVSLLYVTPTTITMVATDDLDGTAPGADSPFGEIGKGIANASGLVLFQAQTAEPTDSPDSLNLWTSGGGMSTLVSTGTGLPLGPGTFQGFPPHMDLNSGGAAAFTAGLSINASCDGDDFNGNSPDGPGTANLCRGVYYSPDGSTIVELARTTIARTAGGTGSNVSSDGFFEFQQIGSVAVLADNGTVFFQAENQNPDPLCGLPNTGEDQAFGGNGETGGPTNNRNDVTAIIAARVGFESLKVIAEGDVLPEGKVMRLFTPMPELRQHEAGDDFVIRAWFDTTGNCVPNSERTILASATFPGPIPALGPWGVWLLVGVLAILGGARLLPRRNS